VLKGLASNARLRSLISLDLSNNVSLGARAHAMLCYWWCCVYARSHAHTTYAGKTGASHLAEFCERAEQLRYLNLSNNVRECEGCGVLVCACAYVCTISLR
jgi:hypothetical protein